MPRLPPLQAEGRVSEAAEMQPGSQERGESGYSGNQQRMCLPSNPKFWPDLCAKGLKLTALSYAASFSVDAESLRAFNCP